MLTCLGRCRIAGSAGIDTGTLQAEHCQWLLDTPQLTAAGEVRQGQGSLLEALHLFLRGGSPARAAQVHSLEAYRRAPA